MIDRMRFFRETRARLAEVKSRLMVAYRTGENLEEIINEYEVERFRYFYARDWVRRGSRVRSNEYYQGVCDVLNQSTDGHFGDVVISTYLMELPPHVREYLMNYLQAETIHLNSNNDER